MDLAELTTRVNGALAGAGFTDTVKFDFGSVGKLFIDGPAGKASNEDKDAKATISVAFDDFQKLAQGALDRHQDATSPAARRRSTMSSPITGMIQRIRCRPPCIS